ncbi:hypothetical protein CKO28_00385 [Rhodovibrio sodomensis]|uniref:Uncharacterized protein n=1 Tax=Rhodovibrio sodomensis TaxID=1088 RepID=A0ABS1D8P8_9PROT|nr:hypothetical protein [Rhodovibrio sodomensis]MBK1666497.1 hypothetical protein [Rhodovibrio sodomensis]
MHNSPSADATLHETRAKEAALDLGKALRLMSYRNIDTIVADFAMYQADRLIQTHRYAESDRPSLERSLRLHAQQGLAAPVPSLDPRDRASELCQSSHQLLAAE